MPLGSEEQRLIQLDRRLAEVAAWLNPSRLLNPTMESRRRAVKGLRKAIAGGRLENPTLEYLPLPTSKLAEVEAALGQLTYGDTDVDTLLRGQADDMLAQIDLLRARGTRRFRHKAAALYGLPSPELVTLAYRVLAGEQLVGGLADDNAHRRGKRIDATTMASEMAAALRDRGIHDWNVVVLDEMSARMSVSARHREVRVKTDGAFSPRDRDRLIVHELGAHVQRAENGFKTGLLALGLGLRGYIATEEGVASHLEQRHGLLQRSHVRMYALRAIGVHLSESHSFAGVYRELLDLGAGPAVAWDVALRVKRGLSDTSMPGGFPKDYAYLHGRQLIDQFFADGGDEADLFLGKIGIQHIASVRAILSSWSFIEGGTA